MLLRYDAFGGELGEALSITQYFGDHRAASSMDECVLARLIKYWQAASLPQFIADAVTCYLFYRHGLYLCKLVQSRLDHVGLK